MGIGIAIGVVVGIVLMLMFVITLQSDHFTISRSGSIDAPPEAVFPHINTLRKWEAWNPWGKLDPDMKMTYEGPEQGIGCSYSWDGNKNVGAGKCTITESRPNDLVQVRLEFFRPFRDTSVADFSIAPSGHGSTVTWTMTGEKNYMAKAMHLVMNMEKMIGPQFEKGLADMKTAVESERTF